MLWNVLDFKLIIGSSITGDIRSISSFIFAKCLIALRIAAEAASIKADFFPVTIVPSESSKAIAEQIQFLSLFLPNVLADSY